MSSEMVVSIEDRTFRLWDYRLGHKQLLLRSEGTSEEEPQIDVVAKNVDFISLPTQMHGMTIRMVTSDAEVMRFRRATYAHAELGRLYTIQSSSGSGFLVAGLIRHVTYDGDWQSLCPLLI